MSAIGGIQSGARAADVVDAGQLPAWEVTDLPQPPTFTFRNWLALLGTGTILLGISIGSGEWLIGPAVTAQYGAVLLWVATVSIILQTFLNMEFARYTIYTGEPIFTGFMRTRPGPAFWGTVYTLLTFFQIGWPGWALSAATALAAMYLGRAPGADDAGMVRLFGYGTFALCILLVLLGNKVQRTMEWAQSFMILWILTYLVYTAIFLVSPQTWATVARGFVSFGSLPQGGDWFLLASFAAYAGAGGVANAALTNWVRDKGIGMGQKVGYIPAILGGRKVELAHQGKVFPTTPENVARFKQWWKFLEADQWWVWALGCFLGMALPALLTVQFVPAGTTGSQWAIATRQAQGIAAAGGSILWTLTLINGFWILFSTQLGLTEMFARLVTDLIWTGSTRARAIGDVRVIYYGALAVFVLFGVWAIGVAQPFFLILLGAFIAGFNFVVLGLHALYVNRKFLPREVQAPLWRNAMVVIAVLFFAFFTIVALQQNVIPRLLAR
jgi:hypothetical protein